MFVYVYLEKNRGGGGGDKFRIILMFRIERFLKLLILN